MIPNVLLCVLLLSSGLWSPVRAQASHSPFLTGADLSELPYHESQGVKYYDGGKPQDLLAIARRNGWAVIRVRLWVNPGSGPRKAVSGLPGVTAFGKRIKAAGLKFLLDIHYSDTWADPGHQKKPAAWDALPFPQLVAQVHDYSRDVIARLRRNGASPDIVQVGNETKHGLLYGSEARPGGGFWEGDKKGIYRAVALLRAGLAGVRDGARPAKPPRTMIHVPDGQDAGFVKWYFATLAKHSRPAKLDYDLIGLSYYPGAPWDQKAGYEPWRVSHLAATMDYIAKALHKPVMVVETSWPQAGRPGDMPGTPEFPFTPQGQVQFYRALLRAMRAVPNGLGAGVVAWDADTLNWNSVFDGRGNALPAVRVLGQQ